MTTTDNPKLPAVDDLAAQLAAALALQTATSDVLRVISANPGDPSTVLAQVVAKAAELCGQTLDT